MESDSSLPAIALAASLAFFVVFSVGEACIASIRRDQAQRLVSRGATGSVALASLFTMRIGSTGALSLLMALASSASLLSTVALVVAMAGVNWTLVSIAALGILILLGVIHSISRILAASYGEQVALRIAPLVRALTSLLKPALAIEVFLSQRILGASVSSLNSVPDIISAELSLSLDPDGEPLDEHEVRMIKGIVRLDKTIAREIMIPRVDMVTAENDIPIAELVDMMITGGHSRIPIYSGDLDHIEGIAHSRDLLRHLVESNGISEIRIENVIRPPLFIPESKSLEELLNEFQQVRVHMAIVVDEYGGVSGLVTIEDLLEEIVGEIQDEFDVGEPEVESISDNELLLDARVSIDQLNDLLGVSVEGEGFDTVGGFVYQQLGKIPSQGDFVEYDGIKIEVLSTVGRRLKRLRVVKSVPQDSKPR